MAIIKLSIDSLGLSYPVLKVFKIRIFENQNGFNSTNLLPTRFSLTFSGNVEISLRLFLVGCTSAFRFVFLVLLIFLRYHYGSLLLRPSGACFF